MFRFLIVLGLTPLWAGCPRHTRGNTEVRAGSCETVCSRYLYCKKSEDPALHTECISDCRFIFHDEGRPDTDSLGHLQSLGCDKLLSFIEGEDGRPLGEAPPQPPPTPDNRAHNR